MKFLDLMYGVARHLNVLHPQGHWEFVQKSALNSTNPWGDFLSKSLQAEITVVTRSDFGEPVEKYIRFDDAHGFFKTLEVRGISPKGANGVTPYCSKAMPTANVGIAKGAEKIAADILRRVVTPYLAILTSEILPRIEANNFTLRREDEGVNKICAAMGIKKPEEGNKVDLRQKGMMSIFPFESNAIVYEEDVHFDFRLSHKNSIKLARFLRGLRPRKV